MYSFPDLMGFPGGSDGKASACNEGDPGLIPGSGRSLENGNLLQYSCLENSWIKEPGGLQSKGSQRVDHDFAFTFLFPIWNQSVVLCPVLLLLDMHTDVSGGAALGWRFHLGALASGSWIVLLHRRNHLAGSLVSVGAIVSAHPEPQASVRVPADCWAREGTVRAWCPRKKLTPASWSYLQASPALCPSIDRARAWPVPRSWRPRQARVMLQMETQLQSIFEEVVVSGTARDPGRWLGEGVAGEQRLKKSGPRNLPPPLPCCDIEYVCKGWVILKLLSNSVSFEIHNTLCYRPSRWVLFVSPRCW